MATITKLLRRTTPITYKRATTTPSVAKMSQSRAQHTFTNYLVTPTELSSTLASNPTSKLSTSPRVVPLCSTWFLPNDPQKRQGGDLFLKSRIPSARFFDLDKVADTSSPYPHMLPSPEVFRDAMQDLGVRRDDVVVVYDSAELGIFSAPRVAWTLRIFGHPAVHILNNFRLYCEQDLPLESGEPDAAEKSQYPLPEMEANRVVAFEEVKTIAHDHNKEGHEPIQILDARSQGRFDGREPEPRPGLSSGHIPGSLAVPVPELLDAKSKAFLPAEELRKIFEAKGVDPSMPIVSSCGTGVTATIIDAALTEAGWGDGSRRVYDGSWTEWAMRVKPEENLIHKADGV